MVATSDPQMRQSLPTFKGRLINTLVGCAIGLVFIAFGHTEWQLPAALALAVLVSSYVVRVPTMWRQAPITAAIVVAGSLQHHDKLVALQSGAVRVGEVLLGLPGRHRQRLAAVEAVAAARGAVRRQGLNASLMPLNAAVQPPFCCDRRLTLTDPCRRV